VGKVLPEITADLQRFIEAQPLFFVATAPLAPDGHVNVSPKGLDGLRILAPDRVAYLDLTGSGNETAAHLHENARITLMLCAFSGPPRIVRLYGRGRTVLPTAAEWSALQPHFPDLPGARHIVLIDVERVQTSCGFGVPLMGDARPRDTLVKWAAAKGAEKLTQYRADRNAVSIDGLPAPVA
jgi:hypothetical protein